MNFSLALYVTLVRSVSAATINNDLVKRQGLTILMCKDLDLRPGPTGGCTSITTANGGCYADFSQLNQRGWELAISAAVLYEAGRLFRCNLYEHPFCQRRMMVAYNEKPQNPAVNGVPANSQMVSKPRPVTIISMKRRIVHRETGRSESRDQITFLPQSQKALIQNSKTYFLSAFTSRKQMFLPFGMNIVNVDRGSSQIRWKAVIGTSTSSPRSQCDENMT
ncbi:hypothetical protein C8J57DRAFT_1213538 [Mycena rebaudengoi]|nr:hypothetical protein C8J57DRAFT_1213538 [Mycena rebaudengoi]